MEGVIQNWFRRRLDLIQAYNPDNNVPNVRLVWDIILNSIENAIEYGRWALHMVFLEPWRRIIIDVEDVQRNRDNSLPELLDSDYGIYANGCSSSLHFDDDLLTASEMDPNHPNGTDVFLPMAKMALQTEDEGYEWETKPLPPAFLRSYEYPLEWLVYQPMTGVIPRRKTEGIESDETGRQKQETSIHTEDKESDNEEKKCDSIPSISDSGEQLRDQQWNITEPSPRQNTVAEHSPEYRSIPVAHSMPILRSTVIT
jgi:hypothetical protein